MTSSTSFDRENKSIKALKSYKGKIQNFCEAAAFSVHNMAELFNAKFIEKIMRHLTNSRSFLVATFSANL